MSPPVSAYTSVTGGAPFQKKHLSLHSVSAKSLPLPLYFPSCLPSPQERPSSAPPSDTRCTSPQHAQNNLHQRFSSFSVSSYGFSPHPLITPQPRERGCRHHLYPCSSHESPDKIFTPVSMLRFTGIWQYNKNHARCLFYSWRSIELQTKIPRHAHDFCTPATLCDASP